MEGIGWEGIRLRIKTENFWLKGLLFLARDVTLGAVWGFARLGLSGGTGLPEPVITVKKL
jgi:hypothetical protein